MIATLLDSLWSDPNLPWYGGTALAVLLGALAAALLLRDRLFAIRLGKALADPALAGELFRERYGPRTLARRSRQIERLAEKRGPLVAEITGIDQVWIDRLRTRGRRRDLLRVLRFAPEKGLPQAFRTAMDKPKLAPEFLQWLERAGDLLQLRRVALAAAGQPIAGDKARELFKGKLDQVREMAGDPEWPVRFFAFQILLDGGSEKSLQALWDGLADSHPVVRKAVLSAFRPADRQRLYDLLLGLALGDPAFEVREAAWQRINAEFAELRTLNADALQEGETLHVLELLSPASSQDEQFAFRYLPADDLELRLPAARLLERSGALLRLCLDVHFGDREGLERNLGLLRKAREVHVAGFLAPCIERSQNPASLYLCARLLPELENQQPLAAALGRKVFALPAEGDGWQEVYGATLECLAAAGDAETMRLLSAEIERWRSLPRPMAMVLNALPARGAPFFLDGLMRLFGDPEFPLREELRGALRRMPAEWVLPWLLDVVRAPWVQTPIPVRIDAVRLLVEMKVPYCLETVLENLWLLPPQEAREVMALLADYPRALFAAKVNRLLGSRDSRMRASIIRALPAARDPKYLESIRRILSDVDPDVRIAAIWALTEFDGFDWAREGIAVLRDPVERVRAEAAQALGTVGAKNVIEALRQRLNDEDEALSVKEAAVRGLEHATATGAVDVLVDRLEDESLREAIVRALSGKVEAPKVARLIERFKDAQGGLRQALTGVFRSMGERGGAVMADLLQEDIASLRPYILEVLEASGHLERQIRRLSHRDVKARRAAAAFLTSVGSLPALRGLVLAAKDPDEQVRIAVVQALERLASAQSRELLEALQNDPARKVRRYTLWALERVKAKAL